jgi:hypothetical protein
LRSNIITVTKAETINSDNTPNSGTDGVGEGELACGEGVKVGIGVKVPLGVLNGVGVGVGDEVGVRVGTAVWVGVGVGTAVGAGVDCGVGAGVIVGAIVLTGKGGWQTLHGRYPWFTASCAFTNVIRFFGLIFRASAQLV